MNSPQEAFIWTNNFENAIPAENLQKTVLAIDDGFPDVRLAPVDVLMRNTEVFPEDIMGEIF
jgi:GntR family transcriptional regulator/MocR family aminotransferase